MYGSRYQWSALFLAGAVVATVEGLQGIVLSMHYTALDDVVTRASLCGTSEGFNDWGGRGYDDFVPGEVTKTAPSGDETT